LLLQAADVIGSIVDSASLEAAAVDAENLASRGGDGVDHLVFGQVDRPNWVQPKATVQRHGAETDEPERGIQPPPRLKPAAERDSRRYLEYEQAARS
jgi:hypothetical protein